MTSLGVYFAVGGSVKWLCGGRGAACLYVRPDLAGTLEPASPAGRHARPFAFQPEQDYAEGVGALPDRHAERARALCRNRGYDLVEEVGSSRIRECSRPQTARPVELLHEAGYPVGSR